MIYAYKEASYMKMNLPRIDYDLYNTYVYMYICRNTRRVTATCLQLLELFEIHL